MNHPLFHSCLQRPGVTWNQYHSISVSSYWHTTFSMHQQNFPLHPCQYTRKTRRIKNSVEQKVFVNTVIITIIDSTRITFVLSNFFDVHSGNNEFILARGLALEIPIAIVCYLTGDFWSFFLKNITLVTVSKY